MCLRRAAALQSTVLAVTQVCLARASDGALPESCQAADDLTNGAAELATVRCSISVGAMAPSAAKRPKISLRL